MTTRSPNSLGRRILPAVVLTTAASGLVALLDQPSAGSAGAAGDAGGSSTVSDQGAANQAAADQGAVPATTTPPVVSSTVPATPASQSQPVAGNAPPTAPATTPTTVAAATGGECVGQTIDGPTVDTRWGPVQVEAVVSASGDICDVDAIQSPDSHGRSVRINQQALPILHKEVMKAQSAQISGVSGATITTRGYQRSLQSILDNLG